MHLQRAGELLGTLDASRDAVGFDARDRGLCTHAFDEAIPSTMGLLRAA
jgi:hypothetical protein